MDRFDTVAREQGLHKDLTKGQMIMISLGGAIGTTLFLSSGVALGYAGPSVLVSYAIAGFIAAAAAKRDALAALGARVIRVPFDDWWGVMATRRFDGAEGVFIHPVAESAVVAGNATIGAEILEDLDRFDSVVAPFGGGGLISGIGSVMRRERPGVRMIAVESQASQPAAGALAAGRPVTVKHDQSFVDGIGSSTVLEPMWPLIRQTVDEAACVTFEEITDAIRLLAARHHVIAEGAGAAPLAAALSGRAGQGDIVCVISGGNLDPAKLAMILSGQEPF